MASFLSLFSFIYVAEQEIAYYENVESNKIMQHGFHLHFIWNSHNLKYAYIKHNLLIPVVFGLEDEFTEQNITVDYTVNNIQLFVKRIQENDNICMFEIIKFVQNGTIKTSCAQIIFHDKVYEIIQLTNTTIDSCGITITNVTFPIHNVEKCKISKNVYNNNASITPNSTIYVTENVVSSTTPDDDVEDSNQKYTTTDSTIYVTENVVSSTTPDDDVEDSNQKYTTTDSTIYVTENVVSSTTPDDDVEDSNQKYTTTDSTNYVTEKRVNFTILDDEGSGENTGDNLNTPEKHENNNNDYNDL